ncbi:PH domain-containing protein [[Clostridium] colinum]|uniref:PH domain-containing protein n=1 Tax=[Clostridium] colinum TaxID=36835 RepID=UPI0020259AA7|nr:PH domain-containing protein [[Clostridium] colinum]
MANLFNKITSDVLGTSDIGKIISPKDFDKVEGDDYILYESGEKIYFVIKSKMDEYVFTNKALIHVDGESAISKKRQVIRYDYCKTIIQSVILETAGTIDLDAELKFYANEKFFSIDVSIKQIEQLKDLYKALVEIEICQRSLKSTFYNAIKSLELANKCVIKDLNNQQALELIKELTKFNFEYTEQVKKEYIYCDYGYIFEKYINN